MRNLTQGLQIVSRVLLRASLAFFTCIVLLLVQSVFWTPAASPAMRVLIAAIAVLTYFRPHLGLLVVVAFTPLGRLLSELLDSPARVSEAIVLACLAGALVRGWTLHRFHGFPENRLQVAALVFGLIVFASCLEQLWLLQLKTDFPGRFVAGLLHYAAGQYIGAYRGFRTVFFAMLLLEGAALLVLAAHCCDRRRDLAPSLVRMLVIVTVGVSALNLAFFANELIDTGDPRAHLVRFLTRERFSAHVGDVNAAGSFLAMGFVIAVGLAAADRSRRWAFSAPIAIFPALWLTSSRAALLAVVAVGVGAGVRHLVGRLRKPVLVGAFVVVGVVAAGLLAATVLPSRLVDAKASRAGNIRLMFLETTGQMLRAYPLFGLGVGQYAAWSGRFSSPELRAIYPSENAHNNFAQIAGELGAAGLGLFLVVLTVALQIRSRKGDAVDRASRLVLMGVLAFLITCLAGHPLLLPEIAYDFWLALGIAAVGVSGFSLSAQVVARVLVAAVAIVLVVSVGPRVSFKTRAIDLSGVTYGLSGGRFADSHARVLVPEGATEVTVPLRGRGATIDNPIEIHVSLNGARVTTVTMRDRRWLPVRVPLDPGGTARLHQVDLEIRPIS